MSFLNYQHDEPHLWDSNMNQLSAWYLCLTHMLYRRLLAVLTNRNRETSRLFSPLVLWESQWAKLGQVKHCFDPETAWHWYLSILWGIYQQLSSSTDADKLIAALSDYLTDHSIFTSRYSDGAPPLDLGAKGTEIIAEWAQNFAIFMNTAETSYGHVRRQAFESESLEHLRTVRRRRRRRISSSALGIEFLGGSVGR